MTIISKSLFYLSMKEPFIPLALNSLFRVYLFNINEINSLSKYRSNFLTTRPSLNNLTTLRALNSDPIPCKHNIYLRLSWKVKMKPLKIDF